MAEEIHEISELVLCSLLISNKIGQFKFYSTVFMTVFAIISLMDCKIKHFLAHTREKRSFLLDGFSTNETQLNIERESCTMFENICLAVTLSDAVPSFKLLIPD